MAQVKEDKITDLVALPLYPQFSISTSGSSLRLLQQIMETDPSLKDMRHVVIPAWYNSNKYLEAMADMIENVRVLCLLLSLLEANRGLDLPVQRPGFACLCLDTGLGLPRQRPGFAWTEAWVCLDSVLGWTVQKPGFAWTEAGVCLFSV